MSLSDTSVELAKKQLEKLTFPHLRDEAKKYGIRLSTDVRERWIDAIIDHLTRYGPLRECPTQQTDGAEETYLPGTLTTGNQEVDPVPEIFLLDAGTQKPPTNKSQSISESLIMEQLQLQKEQMSHQQKILQQMSQQQILIQQLFASININQGHSRNQPLLNESIGLSLSQDSESHRVDRFPDISSAATGQAVKFLSSQIPTYGGTDDEDIETWIEKIENVAEIHNLSQVVMLAAATSKLTKIARRWLDLCTGEVNRSWLSFKSAILDHFRREVLFYDVMQKIEARKWNTATESFRDYAMDKLALMHRLKLEDSDKIKLIINGINNLSIKCAAATVRVNSLNQFIREVHYIAASCSDSFKKFQYANAKTDKFKDINLKGVKTNALNSSQKDSLQPGGSKAQAHCVYCHGKDHTKDN